MTEESGDNSSFDPKRRKLLVALAGVGTLALAGGVKLVTENKLFNQGKPETLTEEQQLIKALESDNNTILHPKINETDPQKMQEFWETVASNRQANMLELVRKYPDSARKFIRGVPNTTARNVLKLKPEAERWVEEEIAEKWTGIIYEEIEQPGTGLKPNNYGFQRKINGINGKDGKYYSLLVTGQPDPIPGRSEILSGFAIASILFLPDIGAVRPIKN